VTGIAPADRDACSSEDASFCRLWRKFSGKIWLDAGAF